jgi:hypothetical protein
MMISYLIIYSLYIAIESGIKAIESGIKAIKSLKTITQKNQCMALIREWE